MSSASRSFVPDHEGQEVSGGTIELLDLVARWIHVIAGIMWVGNSLLFNWLDRSLEPAGAPGQTRKPIGTIWLLHSGGFYYVEKTLLEGETLPAPLHWFKWQAYTTWLSGFALLLIVVYYAGGRAARAGGSGSREPQPSRRRCSSGSARSSSGGRCTSRCSESSRRGLRVAAIVWIVGLDRDRDRADSAAERPRRISSRRRNAGDDHGRQRRADDRPVAAELVASLSKGEARRRDAAVSARAKRVSIHNNYFTFPVIVLMVSNHFPSIYWHRLNWLLLLVFSSRLELRSGTCSTSGGLFRRGSRRSPARSPSACSRLWMHRAFGRGITADASSVAFDGPVSLRGCPTRHRSAVRSLPLSSARATAPSGPRPRGSMFDTPEQIVARAARIRERAYVTRTMPPAQQDSHHGR